MTQSLSRRTLLSTLGKTLPSLPFLGLAAQAMANPAAKAGATPDPKAAAAPTCAPVPDTDPVAKGIKYVPDASKVADKPAKMGVEGKNQSCSNCQLYQKQGDVKGEEFGKCTMIATGCVAGKGWCTAWVKKA